MDWTILGKFTIFDVTVSAWCAEDEDGREVFAFTRDQDNMPVEPGAAKRFYDYDVMHDELLRSTAEEVVVSGTDLNKFGSTRVIEELTNCGFYPNQDWDRGLTIFKIRHDVQVVVEANDSTVE